MSAEQVSEQVASILREVYLEELLGEGSSDAPHGEFQEAVFLCATNSPTVDMFQKAFFCRAVEDSTKSDPSFPDYRDMLCTWLRVDLHRSVVLLHIVRARIFAKQFALAKALAARAIQELQRNEVRFLSDLVVIAL